MHNMDRAFISSRNSHVLINITERETMILTRTAEAIKHLTRVKRDAMIFFFGH